VADPVFLDFSVVEILHAESLKAYGGSPGIRDQGLIESALGAATGGGAALLFLRANGVRRFPDDSLIYDAMIAIAEHRLDKPGLAQLFRSAALSPS
jgi:death on curing protein